MIVGCGVPAVDRQLNLVDSPTRSFCGSLGKISMIGGSRPLEISKLLIFGEKN